MLAPHSTDGQHTLQWLTYSVEREKTRKYCSACERSAGSCTVPAVTGQLGQRGAGRGRGSFSLRLESGRQHAVREAGRSRRAWRPIDIDGRACEV